MFLHVIVHVSTLQVEQIHELAVQVGEKVTQAEALGKLHVSCLSYPTAYMYMYIVHLHFRMLYSSIRHWYMYMCTVYSNNSLTAERLMNLNKLE